MFKLRYSWKGKKFSKTHKEYISKGVKEFYSYNPIWNKGIKHSAEHRKNISDGLIKFYSLNPVWNKGKLHLKETKRKISKALKGRISWNKGMLKPIVWTDEMRNKLKLAQSGSNNSNWKGGTSSLEKRIKGSSEWKNWRIQIFTRDNFTCQECGSNKKLHPHHIKPFSVFIELRFDVDNGKTLCKECHKKTDTYGGKAQLRKRGEFGGTPI